MANLVPIKVLFVCQGCGLALIQERLRGAGRFECTECRHPVYEWSGSYDYVLWIPVRELVAKTWDASLTVPLQ